MIYPSSRTIKTIIALVLIAAIAVSLATVLYRIGKIKTTIYLIPGSATLTINNKTTSDGTLYLKPGTYDIAASKDGFASYHNTLVVSNRPVVVDVALAPISDEAHRWVEKNTKLYEAREARGGKAVIEAGEALAEAYPILDRLPYESLLFKIGYTTDPHTPTSPPAITIHAGEGHRQAAIDQIEAWGFNPATLNIQFKNYENPFAS